MYVAALCLRPAPRKNEAAGTDKTMVQDVVRSFQAAMREDAGLAEKWNTSEDWKAPLNVVLHFTEGLVRNHDGTKSLMDKLDFSLKASIVREGKQVAAGVPVMIRGKHTAPNAMDLRWWTKMQQLAIIRATPISWTDSQWAGIKGGAFKSVLHYMGLPMALWMFVPQMKLTALSSFPRPHSIHVVGICSQDPVIFVRSLRSIETSIRDKWWQYSPFSLASPRPASSGGLRPGMLLYQVSSVDEIVRGAEELKEQFGDRSKWQMDSLKQLRMRQFITASAQTPWRELLTSYLLSTLVESRIASGFPTLNGVTMNLQTEVTVQSSDVGITLVNAPKATPHDLVAMAHHSPWMVLQLLWSLAAMNTRLGAVHWDLSRQNMCVSFSHNTPVATTMYIPDWNVHDCRSFCNELQELMCPYVGLFQGLARHHAMQKLKKELYKSDVALQAELKYGGTEKSLYKDVDDEDDAPPLVEYWIDNLDRLTHFMSSVEAKVARWRKVTFVSPVKLSLIDFGTTLSRIWDPMGLTAGNKKGGKVHESKYRTGMDVVGDPNATNTVDSPTRVDVWMGLHSLQLALTSVFQKVTRLRRNETRQYAVQFDASLVGVADVGMTHMHQSTQQPTPQPRRRVIPRGRVAPRPRGWRGTAAESPDEGSDSDSRPKPKPASTLNRGMGGSSTQPMLGKPYDGVQVEVASARELVMKMINALKKEQLLAGNGLSQLVKATDIMQKEVGDIYTVVTPEERAADLAKEGGNILDLFRSFKAMPLGRMLAHMQVPEAERAGVDTDPQLVRGLERMSDIYYFHKYLSSPSHE